MATPGRLVDHLRNTECFRCDQLHWLVLDEADRLLDLGFERDIQFVVQKLNDAQIRGGHFQTVLASATLTEGVQRLATISLKNPLRAGHDAFASDDGSVTTGQSRCRTQLRLDVVHLH